MINRIKVFFGYGWAMPVVSRPWAGVCSSFQIVKRATGYRLGNRAFGYSFNRAVGTQ